MKITIKAILSLFFAAALAAGTPGIAAAESVESYQNRANIGGGLVVLGMLTAIGGGITWAVSEDTYCRAGFASHEGECVSTNADCMDNPNAAVCTVTEKNKGRAKLGRQLALGGAAATIVGLIIRPPGSTFEFEDSGGISFRPTSSGVMVAKTWRF